MFGCFFSGGAELGLIHGGVFRMVEMNIVNVFINKIQ